MGGTVSTSCDVKRSGVYRCLNCDNEVRLEIGEEAPGCVHCNGMPVTWVFIRPLVGRIGFITS